MKYKWKKRPYHHQVEAVKKLLSTGYGGALLMEPRTGKTKVVVDFASILHQAGKVNRILVFAPVNALGVWEDQIAENCPVPYSILIWDRKTRRGRQRGGVRQPTSLPAFGHDRLDFVIVNYDALSTPGRVTGRTVDEESGAVEIRRSRRIGGRFTVKRQIESWQPQMVVLDESHRIKSPRARKSTMIHKLKDIPQYRVIMTGTVVTKKKRIFDIYSQWLFLNPERFADMTFSDFKAQYGRWTERNGYPQWIRNINEKDLHSKIHEDAFSITRDECYDLPKETHQIIHVDLEESADVYDQMARDMVAKIKTGEITEASIKLVQGMRLRQITSGISRTTPSPEYPRGRLVAIGTEKLRAWRDRLEDLMEADEKVVVGALWKADIRRMELVCTKMRIPFFVIKGGMRHADREYSRTQFPKVDGGAVFIGQPAAAGEAIDLSCASILQWYSLTPSWVNFRQFSDRIALSDKPTFHEFFLATSTVDELLYEVLQEDGDIGKKMITSPERLLRLQDRDD